jgi:predicted DsbA family dithiol-disulfide isomerase
MTARLFTDPNCPFCHATEERLLAAGVAGRVEWHGVQHAPELPVPMVPMGAELAAEVEAIRQLAPEVAIDVPAGKPNTRSAIEHAAAALARDPERGRTFVRSLYRAFWTDSADLSDPAVLADLADAAGLPGLTVDGAARRMAVEWDAEWRGTGLAGVPALVRDDGRVLYGLQAEADLKRFLEPVPMTR